MLILGSCPRTAMTLDELKDGIRQYQYIEDDKLIDVILAAIVANRLKLGDPVWIILIGASSGGKSQILRPLALSDPKFMHRIDDVTENTFLSGMKLGKDSGEPSLLTRIGSHGILVISDLTVIFSKAKESMSAILSQFRMIYDGEMHKHVGTSGTPLVWKGSLGIIAGSTPSIYRVFEEVSDMGERFMYYRMKDYDAHKAAAIALNRSIRSKDLDIILSNLYETYLRSLPTNTEATLVSSAVTDRIIEVAALAEKIRTGIVTDWKGDKITHLPIPAMPMRAALQLMSIARALTLMRGRALNEADLEIIDWIAYSLSNEEKRGVLKIICSIPQGTYISTSSVADRIGLDTSIVRNVLQNLSAVNILERTGNGEGLLWKIKYDTDYFTLRRINKVTADTDLKERNVTTEESDETTEAVHHAFMNF